MRLTVGPLPPAVYWRRRAIVLGALLFVLFLLVYRCAGSDPSGAEDGAPGSTGGSPAGTAPLDEMLTPVVEPTASSTPTADLSGPPVTALPSGSCTDAELAVTVTTEGGRVEFAQGTYVRIFLKIENIGTRGCARDVGATAQELRIAQGAVKLWSSDDCGAGTGSDVRTLRPGEQIDQFNVTWNGRASTDCQTKPLPAPGTYQLIGRFGTRWSEPVSLTIRPGK
jgi:hypothetical protein